MTSPIPRTVKSALVENLRDEIILGELVPGQHIRLEEIAVRYDVSTMPVREALRDLESEGLVTIFPQVECTYTFEGTNLLITAVKLSGVQECPSPTGKYEVRLLAEDHIQLVDIKDPCTPRIRSTHGEFQRIP